MHGLIYSSSLIADKSENNIVPILLDKAAMHFSTSESLQYIKTCILVLVGFGLDCWQCADGHCTVYSHTSRQLQDESTRAASTTPP